MHKLVKISSIVNRQPWNRLNSYAAHSVFWARWKQDGGQIMSCRYSPIKVLYIWQPTSATWCETNTNSRPIFFLLTTYSKMVVRGSESKRVELENIFHPHSTHWFWLRHLPYRMTLSSCVLQNGCKSRLVLRTLRLETGITEEWGGLADAGRPCQWQCHWLCCGTTTDHCTGSEQVTIQYYRLGGVKFSWKISYEGVRFNVIIGGGGGMGHGCQTWPSLIMRRPIVTYSPKS